MAIDSIKSRGTTFSQYVSAAYVPMEGIQSIDITGEKSLTDDTTALDGSQYKTKAPTGYSDPCQIKLSGQYNPSHATYTNFVALILAPVATNFRVVYTNSAPTTVVYSGVGFGIDKKIAVDKMVLADLMIDVTGAPA